MRRVISLLAAAALLCGAAGMPAAAAPAQPVDTSGFADEMLRLVNGERAAAGLPALSGTAALNAAAQKRADEITVKFSHTRPGGGDCFTVMNEYGIAGSHRGENLAAGYSDPSQVMAGWMKSSGHRGNILGDFNRLGVGVAVKGGTIHWVQLFVREEARKASAPAWKRWPPVVQWIARVVLLGWIWMK
ncbi:MAG: CAP domain-containing protein [Oscillospiraceae bacterium]|jgi:uncharacterized protein YkwD|nr:CAP domain-containing protein [Oscillospiraceae bacterium]